MGDLHLNLITGFHADGSQSYAAVMARNYIRSYFLII